MYRKTVIGIKTVSVRIISDSHPLVTATMPWCSVCTFAPADRRYSRDY